MLDKDEEWVVFRYMANDSPFKEQLDYESRADWDKWLEALHASDNHHLYYELVVAGLTYEQAKQFVELSN